LNYYTKEDLIECLRHYDSMGFNSIKLSEIQHGQEFFVSFEEVFGISLKISVAVDLFPYLPAALFFALPT
jgi:hypothetical protein